MNANANIRKNLRAVATFPEECVEASLVVELNRQFSPWRIGQRILVRSPTPPFALELTLCLMDSSSVQVTLSNTEPDYVYTMGYTDRHQVESHLFSPSPWTIPYHDEDSSLKLLFRRAKRTVIASMAPTTAIPRPGRSHSWASESDASAKTTVV